MSWGRRFDVDLDSQMLGELKPLGRCGEFPPPSQRLFQDSPTLSFVAQADPRLVRQERLDPRSDRGHRLDPWTGQTRVRRGDGQA